MSNKKRLFGTFGVRRTANDVLTPEFATRLAACYGTQIQGTVAVGGDTRTSTPMLMEAVKAGLLSSGCDVVDLGILPTPGVQYAVRKYYDGGVMITASHNPPKYNGIKFLDADGIGIPDDMELEIERLYFDAEPKRADFSEIGEVYINDKIIDEYIDEAISKVDAEAIRNANLKVVVDCGSGAGCYTAPYLIRKLGCDVTSLNSQPDGFFPGRDPEPIEENLQELISVVKELGADIGLAHDGDADRTICIDEKGNFVLGDKTFTLVEKQMLKENNGGTIVTTVATSQAIYDVAEEFNGEVIATAVGDLLVARKLKDTDGLFGGEENGGLIFPDFVYGRDAVMTVAKILEIVAKESKPLSELVAELPVYYASKMKIECPDDEKEFVMTSIADEIKTTTDFELDLTDGVKILKDDGWVIIRPSGTEPIFRCFAESDSQDKADEMTDWGISLINKYKK
ncbi:MAG: phosphoglucosamine mutase [Methanobrevibacter sp.]|uniref:phosphoglucosamine mutase n=1 Tax=Methanobrevibacter sp. TaxID=66852 RepID=UPI0025809F56|nr:phosphoglucosamine mutase [Methanobrevibacter sp.]MBR2665408.1 phosphoglucosamine mutase [Methanobrevibacter sp.]MBR7050076.1 phosphoglucosamine mutase [Methanobrevibacter sp.]